MDADERKRIEAAMARISRDKKAVEANPTAILQSGVKQAMAEARRRLLRLLLLAGIVAAAGGLVLYWRNSW